MIFQTCVRRLHFPLVTTDVLCTLELLVLVTSKKWSLPSITNTNTCTLFFVNTIILVNTCSYQFASTPVTLRTDNHSTGFSFPSPSLSAASKASRNSFIRLSSRPFLFINAKSPPLILKMYSTMYCTAMNTFPD